jgi:hypothetical protein
MARKLLRWVALAVFCAAFGFAGSVGGMSLMADSLRGAQGPQGEQGIEGPQGTPGTPGARGPAGPRGDVSSVESQVALLRSTVNRLTPRVADLEERADAPPSSTLCQRGVPTSVVTDAQLTRAGNNLALSTTKRTITPCQ